MIEQHVRTYLLANSGVSTLVGTKIYCGFLTELTALPALTVTLVGTYPELTHDSGPGMLTRSEVQVDAWAASYSEVKSLADKVRLALSNYRGDLATGVPVGGSVMTTMLDGDEEMDIENYRVVMRFELWHNDSNS
jgi:hypothetical protein